VPCSPQYSEAALTRSKHILSVILVAAIVYGLFVPNPLALVAPKPFKVIDPTGARFRADEFRFEDYTSDQKLRDALGALFPRRTNREYLEKILVKKVGAISKTGVNDSPVYPKKFVYRYTPKVMQQFVFPFEWIVSAFYTEDDKLGALRLNNISIYE